MTTKRADQLGYSDIGKRIRVTLHADTLEGTLRMIYPITASEGTFADPIDTEVLIGVVVHTDRGTLTVDTNTWVNFI